MYSAFISLLLLASTSQSDKITADYPAQSIEHALKALTEISGEKMLAGAEVANEVVVIRVKDVPIAQVRERLASTIGAQWSKATGVWRLVRPPLLEASQRSDETLRRGRSLVVGIREKVKAQLPYTIGSAAAAANLTALAAERYFDLIPRDGAQATTQMREAARLAPAHRILLQLLSKLDPNILASVRMGEHIVFTSKPTSVQRPLPKGAEDVLAEFNREHKLWLDALGDKIPAISDLIGLDPRYGLDKTLASGTKLVLSLRRPVAGPFFAATLRVVNDDGWVVARATDSVEFAPGMGEMTLLPAKDDAPLLPLPSDVIDFYNLFKFKSGYGGETTKTLDVPALEKRIMDRLLNPEAFDPLNFTVGELLENIAEAKSTNLIALLPDDLLNWYRTVNPAEKQRPNDWLRNVASAARLQIHEQDGWLTIRPDFLVSTREERLDRAELGRFARSVAKKNWLGIDDAADYAHRQKSPLCLLSYDYILGQLGDTPEGSYPASDLSAVWKRAELRVYGALSPGQRQTLRVGGSVTLTELSPEARERLREFLYSWHWTADGTPEFFVPNPPSGSSNLLGHLQREPTEVFPSGVPSTAVIVGVPVIRTVIRGTTPSLSAGKYAAVLPEELAFWTNLGDQPASEDQFATCQLGHAMELGIDFRFGPTRVIKVQFGEVDQKDWSAPMKPADLPKDIRDTAIAAYRKQLERDAENEANIKRQQSKPPLP